MYVCAQSRPYTTNVLLTPAGQRPAAIVSPHAGTTRDVLESALDIFGYPIVLRSIFIACLIITYGYLWSVFWFGFMLSDSVKQGYACIVKRNAVKV